MFIASLLMGAVTIPAKLPACASSTADLMKATEAAPVTSVATPIRNFGKGLPSGSTTATCPAFSLAPFPGSNSTTCSGSFSHLMVRSRMGREPMTTGRQRRPSALSAKALAITSGPIPAGSPMVRPSRGSGAAPPLTIDERRSTVFLGAIRIEIEGIAKVQQCTTAEQPGPPLPGPEYLQQAHAHREHGEDHRSQCGRP